MSDIRDAYRRAVTGFGNTVTKVGADQWHNSTPCTDWDVRTLVNHVVSENRWAPELLAGRTVSDVGAAYDGDLLGDDPVAAFQSSAATAIASATDESVLTRTAHLSFGDVPGAEYLHQIFTDALIHRWDLARAIGADERLEPDLVEICAAWFSDREHLLRQAGLIGPRVEVGPAADPQTRLLAAFGRRAL